MGKLIATIAAAVALAAAGLANASVVASSSALGSSRSARLSSSTSPSGGYALASQVSAATMTRCYRNSKLAVRVLAVPGPSARLRVMTRHLPA
jgi:hypothetical protein